MERPFGAFCWHWRQGPNRKGQSSNGSRRQLWRPSVRLSLNLTRFREGEDRCVIDWDLASVRFSLPSRNDCSTSRLVSERFQSNFVILRPLESIFNETSRRFTIHATPLLPFFFFSPSIRLFS
ncbi:hypothetical protein NPIL_452711 [Nephila pilipes]|uniref:Uncharacterized protein n=1 Tax=Nephila pilipes TaxID=299642 RepID=A0A8X6N260_NEPPI|nr:hypothetical protein NPIL_452711 [Nephila pilipes]